MRAGFCGRDGARPSRKTIKISASLLLCFLCVEINPAPFGYRLLARYSVSWKMAFPDHLKDIGLPFDDAYAIAVLMRGR